MFWIPWQEFSFLLPSQGMGQYPFGHTEFSWCPRGLEQWKLLSQRPGHTSSPMLLLGAKRSGVTEL